MIKHFRSIILLLTIPGFAAASPALGQQSGNAANLLTLQEAVRLALARAPEVSIAQAQAAKAGQALRETRSLGLPQVVTGTGLAYNNGFPLSIEGSAPSIIQVGVNQSILSKKNKNLLREAEEGANASRAGTDAVRNDLAAKTALLYSELHQAQAALPLVEQQLASAMVSQKATEALLEAGRVLPSDVSLARVQTARISYQQRVLRDRIRVAESGLRELTGLPQEQPIRTESPQFVTDLLTLPVDQLYKRACEINPEIRQAEATVRARQFHIEAEKGERYPQFTLVGQYAVFSKANHYQDFFSRFTRNNYLVGLSIQFPLFDGFRTGARVAESAQDAEAARLHLQQLQSDLKVGLERTAGDLDGANGLVEVARLEVSAYETKLKEVETQLEAGRAEPSEVDQVRAQLLDKRIAEIEAQRTLFERQVAVLQTSGSLATLF